MASSSTGKTDSPLTASPLMVRLDEESKQCLVQAAELRHISVSDYVRTVTIPQAKREVRAAQENVITMTSEEQQAFWTALGKVPRLTAAQRRLGSLMRGEA
jgi:uncharacterized protein (DUF1778 family)